MKMKWYGFNKCKKCGAEIHGELHDAPTISGPWATMCKSCFKKFGMSGGNTYFEQEDGTFSYEKKMNENQQFLMDALGLGWDEVLDVE